MKADPRYFLKCRECIDPEHNCLHDIAHVSIDVDESYGSPSANKLFSSFYNEMIIRGYSHRPVFLRRSRGG